LIKALQNECERQKVDLKDLLKACVTGAYQPLSGKNYYEHERPVLFADAGYLHGSQRLRETKKHIPLCAWGSLLDNLKDELVRDTTGDHSAYVVPVGKGVDDRITATVELIVPYKGLIEKIRKTTVLNLDTTPNRWLLKHLLPNAKYETVNCRENVYITQLTDGIFGKSAQERALVYRLKKLVDDALKRWPKAKIGILAKKATLVKLQWRDKASADHLSGFCDADRRRIVLGHWGVSERATNEFKDCEVLIVSGFHQRNLASVARETEAWRLYLNLPRPTQRTVKSISRAYGYIDQCGRGRAHLCLAHPDPDVDELLASSWSANLLQAVGRLRAVRAKATKTVIIDCAMPAEGLLVDKLTTLNEWLGLPTQPAVMKARSKANGEKAARRRKALLKRVRPVYKRLLRSMQRSPGWRALQQKCTAANLSISERDARMFIKALGTNCGKRG